MSNSILYYKKAGVVLPVNTHLKPLQTKAVTYGSNTYINPITATAAASTHTKGAWVELYSSTPYDATLLELGADGTILNGSATSTLLDLSFGSLGNEASNIVLNNLAVGYRNNISTSTLNPNYSIPLVIPAGTRVTARVQSAIASQTVSLTPRLLVQPFGVSNPGAIDTIGADTATSKGVGLTGAAINTKGNYTEITASTSNAYKALFIGVQGNAGITQSAGNIAIDIATGGAGAETIVVHDVIFLSTTSETYSQRSPMQNLYYVDIPAGTRLSARYQRSATNHGCDVIIYGVR